ncbi:Coiled-coil domain-containing protein 191 [Merluccius polli]|uniref:Coiled-coil domain-containing protein 191 n=1 Tax=Merluccius polli TaxID=89951 RepID=A0AA47NRG0_MERPO|nr:Coiled-coil domain-containing protein 191 [Merluccius polli]
MSRHSSRWARVRSTDLRILFLEVASPCQVSPSAMLWYRSGLSAFCRAMNLATVSSIRPPLPHTDTVWTNTANRGTGSRGHGVSSTALCHEDLHTTKQNTSRTNWKCVGANRDVGGRGLTVRRVSWVRWGTAPQRVYSRQPGTSMEVCAALPTSLSTPTRYPPWTTRLKTDHIDEWMKRVEMASEFAASEVFPSRRWTSGATSRVMALQSTTQLQDHDDAYGEAQALLSDWMSSKLRLELELDDEDDPAGSTLQPTVMDYSTFDVSLLPHSPKVESSPFFLMVIQTRTYPELYSHLAEEEEGEAVSSFLQDLMDRELLDPGTAEDLVLDLDQGGRKTRDPSVRENRARRDAERESQRRAREARRGAEEEARRRERAAEARRREEARRQEAMVQKETVRLRRQMEEQRALEQLVRQREREKLDRQKTAVCPPRVGPPVLIQDQHNPPSAEQNQARIHMVNLQRHLSGWYSVVLEQRLRLGRAAALCDWRRSLRAWRAWRALVRDQLATGGDRRRLLRRCFNDWQLWCQTEKGQRELLAQREQTRSKMAALISAASIGRPKGPEAPARVTPMAPAKRIGPPGITEEGKDGHPDGISTVRQNNTDVLTPAPSSGCQGDAPGILPVTRPSQPWQVTRRHATISVGELRQVQQRGGGGEGGRGGGGGGPDKGSRFEHRHAAQQHTIARQKKLLREQQEQILQLQEERGLLETRGTAPQPRPSKAGSPSILTANNPEPPEQRDRGWTSGGRTLARKAANQQQPCPDPVVTAMEERARRRLERKREVEELRRKKEEEKLAQIKAAEEERRREEEEARRGEAQRRKEERMLQREREEEKRQRLRREQELQTTACHHHHRSLLLRRGLAPWQHLLHLKRGNEQLAVNHHRGRVLLTCLRAWKHWARDSLSEKRAAADQLNRHLLLRQSLARWQRLVEQRAVLEERAQGFHRARVQRRVLHALLDHLTREKMLEWDRLELAQQHSNRRALWRCLLVWRRYPSLQREEREKEARREQLRRRVAEVLPDFRNSPLGPSPF